jgi:hypothetical protein
MSNSFPSVVKCPQDKNKQKHKTKKEVANFIVFVNKILSWVDWYFFHEKYTCELKIGEVGFVETIRWAI